MAMKISSEDEYGVFQFIVDDPEKGFRAFKQAGITVSLKDVLAVGVANKSGSLHHMLSILRKDDINVEDCYGLRGREREEGDNSHGGGRFHCCRENT
ncbi:MAG: hypothetical protein WA977_05895 [Halobacteriota archaeon]